MATLAGKIALVAGATRGAGRGIARMLGEAGATVYCSGRSTRGNLASGPGRPETIDETAELVTAAGGRGIAVRTDHLDVEQVRSLVRRIEQEQGRLDILVNDIWGGEPLTEFGKTLWEVSLEQGFTMLRQAIDTHIITSHEAVPLMLRSGQPGLIVEITDGDFYGYRGNIFYDLVKTTVIRLAFIQAFELRKKGITAVAVTPGFLRSEAMLDHFGVTDATWREAGQKDPSFLASETPCFVGRAVAALAADPAVAKKSGRVFSSWGLSEEYGFTDIDGAQPHFGRYFIQAYGKSYPACDDGFYQYWTNSPGEVVFPDWPP